MIIIFNSFPDCVDPNFLCENKFQCVHFDRICDGNRDCVDGTDETNAPCLGKKQIYFFLILWPSQNILIYVPPDKFVLTNTGQSLSFDQKQIAALKVS